MTGLREELDICAIAHQIEIKNVFLNDRLSNTLYTSSNCNTKIGGLQNTKTTKAAAINRVDFILALATALNRFIFASFP